MRRKFAENKKKIRILKVNIIIFCILAIIAIVIFKFPDSKKEAVEEVNFSDVSKICELATLRCYYHDVAEFQKDSTGLFSYGAKKMWMEYNGVVSVGVDVEQVKVETPTDDGVVKIYVPQAIILDINADKTTISDPIEETGILTKITADEKAQAFSAAQATMRENAESDTKLLNQAHNNAKELLKQYVLTVGKQIGQNYTVQWIENTNSEEDKK